MANKEATRAVVGITLRLLIICLVVAALVALVYTVTKDPIAEGDRARKEQAIRGIFAAADSFEESKGIEGEGVLAVYYVLDQNGQGLGHCVDYMGVSDYGGDVNMMIGVDMAGRVVGLQVISHGETFMDRYTDENGRYTGIGQPYGADVSAGATMSYNAIRNAIRAIEEMFLPDGSEKGNTSSGAGAALEQDPYRADMQQLFANGIAFLRQTDAEGGNVDAVYAVEDATGKALGHCVAYTSQEGYRGEIELLMARDVAGRVMRVKVLRSFDEHVGFYTDANGLFQADATAGATSKTHRAIENAIAAVETLQLGGAL